MDWMKAGRNHPVGQWHLRRQEFAERDMDISRFIDLMNIEFTKGVLGSTTYYLFTKLGQSKIARRRMMDCDEWFNSRTKPIYNGDNESECHIDNRKCGLWEDLAAQTRADISWIHQSIPEYLRCLKWYSNQPELAGVVELHKMLIDEIIEVSGYVRPKTIRRGRRNMPKDIFNIHS
jgi:hypothetical protein